VEELIEARRKAFEAWRLAKFCGGDERLKKCSNAPDVYYHAAEQEAWKVWSAALDSVVVELPPTVDANDVADAFSIDEEGHDMAVEISSMVNGAIAVCEQRINAAGINTKVGT
jgi:hypothetical protein